MNHAGTTIFSRCIPVLLGSSTHEASYIVGTPKAQQANMANRKSLHHIANIDTDSKITHDDGNN